MWFLQGEVLLAGWRGLSWSLVPSLAKGVSSQITLLGRYWWGDGKQTLISPGSRRWWSPSPCLVRTDWLQCWVRSLAHSLHTTQWEDGARRGNSIPHYQYSFSVELSLTPRIRTDQGSPRRASWQSFVLFLTWWQWGQVMSGGSGSVFSKRSGPLCLAWVAGLRGGMVLAQSYQRQRVGESVGTPSGVGLFTSFFLI